MDEDPYPTHPKTIPVNPSLVNPSLKNKGARIDIQPRF